MQSHPVASTICPRPRALLTVTMGWALAVAGCGGPDDTGGPGGPASPDAGPVASDPAAPRFLSFGTNVTSLTEDESVIFTAVLTDPDGIDDLIGGSLTSPDGQVQYGAFATSGQEGSYTITLSWEAMHQAQDITFATGEPRQFRAEFFDVAGHAVTRMVTIGLTCDGQYACGGACRDMCYVSVEQRATCAAACEEAGMTCYLEDTDRLAGYRYNSTTVNYRSLATCATVPAATYNGDPFAFVSCHCHALD